MYVFLILLLVLLAVCFIYINANVEYDKNGFSVLLKLLFLKIAFPSKKEKKPKKNENEKTADKKKTSGSLKAYLQLVKPIIKVSGKLFTTIKIDELTTDVVLAGEDAYKTAMMYGGASAAIGMVLPLAESKLKIEKKTISISADFSKKEAEIYLYLRISIRIWQVIMLGGYFLYLYLKNKLKERK